MMFLFKAPTHESPKIFNENDPMNGRCSNGGHNVMFTCLHVCSPAEYSTLFYYLSSHLFFGGVLCLVLFFVVGAWMAQWFTSKMTPVVSDIGWKLDSDMSDVTLRIYFSLLWHSCCRDDCNSVFGWPDTDGYHRHCALFLQPQMVSSWPCASNVLAHLSYYQWNLCHCTNHLISCCRLKVHLWPVVPDPANSSIKRWTSESTQVLNKYPLQDNYGTCYLLFKKIIW